MVLSSKSVMQEKTHVFFSTMKCEKNLAVFFPVIVSRILDSSIHGLDVVFGKFNISSVEIHMYIYIYIE